MKSAKAAAARLSKARVMFMPAYTAGKDALIVAIGKITHEIFGIDYNNPANMLHLVGVGMGTRECVVAQYRVMLSGAKKAGWTMLIDDGSVTPAGEIDI
jgi:hypothetical protein